MRAKMSDTSMLRAAWLGTGQRVSALGTGQRVAAIACAPNWRPVRLGVPVLCEELDDAAVRDGRSGALPRLGGSRLTVKALQIELRERGLKVSGSKAELVRRLEAWNGSVAPSTGSYADDAVEPTRASAPQIPLSPSTSPTSRPASPGPEPASLATALSAAPTAGSSVKRTPTPRQSAVDPSAAVWRIASWNVAGLRGLLKKEHGAETLRRLVQEEGVGVILLQETKLQPHHVAEVEPQILGTLAALSAGVTAGGSWRAAWSCSTARKGYAGVATLWNEAALGIAGQCEASTPPGGMQGQPAASPNGGTGVCSPLDVHAAHEAGEEGRALWLRLPLPGPHTPDPGSTEDGAAAVPGGGSPWEAASPSPAVHEPILASRVRDENRSGLDENSSTVAGQAAPSPTLELALVNVYTPNSGAGLVRLEYRVGEDGWDKRFVGSLRGLLAGNMHSGSKVEGGVAGSSGVGGGLGTGAGLELDADDALVASGTAAGDVLDSDDGGGGAGPTGGGAGPTLAVGPEGSLGRRALVAAGDFNVAVHDADIWNAADVRIGTQAGTTPRERASMRHTLTAFSDAFRIAHPHAEGQFTFWSQRARARPINRGLRLDYFLLCEAVATGAGALVDVQHLHLLEGSDHCPLVLTLDARAIAAALSRES